MLAGNHDHWERRTVGADAARQLKPIHRVRHLHVSDDKIHNGGRGKDCCGFISRGRFHHVVTFKAQPLGEGMPQNRIIFSNENIRHALRFRIVNENSADPAVLNATDSHPVAPRHAKPRLTESDWQQVAELVVSSHRE